MPPTSSVYPPLRRRWDDSSSDFNKWAWVIAVLIGVVILLVIFKQVFLPVAAPPTPYPNSTPE
ncbi:hypothetical protein SCLCIDRAFT_1211262 [Scleroderma citrinum Foug A]|uniref:Uncharacterized protein n=1 Tax=Scleroderma citrinum Foug A TaxID=1036808 RepID=A0A0C3EF29_9AGAM|nr:hypothetical protein SCLCIDRAFT_1211262 [Scleroderma citrinum Foug A]